MTSVTVFLCTITLSKTKKTKWLDVDATTAVMSRVWYSRITGKTLGFGVLIIGNLVAVERHICSEVLYCWPNICYKMADLSTNRCDETGSASVKPPKAVVTSGFNAQSGNFPFSRILGNSKISSDWPFKNSARNAFKTFGCTTAYCPG